MTPEPTTTSRSGSASQVVDLLPREDALAVGPRGVHDPRRRPGGDEHDVGVELLHPLRGLGPHRRRRGERGPPGEHPHAHLGEPRGDVPALCRREGEHPAVDLGELRHGIRDLVALGVLEVHAEVRRRLELAHVVRGRDEGLARHAVGEHGRTPEAVTLDDGDLGPEVGGDEGGLVPPGPPPRMTTLLDRALTAPIQPPCDGAAGHRRVPEAPRPADDDDARQAVGRAGRRVRGCRGPVVRGLSAGSLGHEHRVDDVDDAVAGLDVGRRDVHGVARRVGQR